MSTAELLQRGMSPFDVRFFEGQASGFPMADDDVKAAEETHRLKRARQA
jgi:hypothetical protein